MSWPIDGKPRYTVGVIHGGSVDGNPARKPEGYVYDRANCHRIVRPSAATRKRSYASAAK